MAKVIWGMDFGDWSLKVVRGTSDKSGGAITVDLFDEIVYGELPCGYEASKLDKHREGVIAFRSRHQIAPSDALCVSVTGSEVFSRFINLPPVPESVDKIIRYEAGQQIPFPMTDVVWDYQQVKEQTEVGEDIEVGLFALKKERVQELMDLLEPWHRNLRVIQNAPLAVYNLLEYEGMIQQPTIVLDVGASTTDVLVLNPPRFWVRSLLVAGDDLTNALVEQFGISVEEGEKIKRKAARSAHKEQILRILQPVFDDLVNEVQRSLGYYKSLARGVKFEKVLALGSGLKMAGLSQMLAGGLQYQVASVRELTKMQVAPSLDQEQFRAALPGICAALGLLVQGAGQSRVKINMVPEDVTMAAAVSAKKPWLVGAVVGIGLAAGIMVLGEQLYASDLAVSEAAAKWGVVDEAQKYEQDYAKEQGNLDKVVKELKTITAPGVDPAVFLKVIPAIAQTLPDDVYLTQLDCSWFDRNDVDKGVPPLQEQAGARRGGQPAFEMPMFEVPEMDQGGGFVTPGAPVGSGRQGGGRAPGGLARPGVAGGPAGTTGEAGGGNPGAKGDADKVMVVRFAGECTRVNKDYLDDAVFGALRQAQYGDQPYPAFTEVKMLGNVGDVWRRESDGESIALSRSSDSDAGKDKEKTIKLLAFQGYAVVNLTGKAASQPAAAGTARPAGGGRQPTGAEAPPSAAGPGGL